MINILKFGGTSLADAKKILFVSKIIEEKSRNNQIAVVLSAPAKITNYLEKLIKYSIKKNNFKKIILKIQNKFIKIIKKIFKKKNKIFFKKILKIIKKEIIFLEKTAKKIYNSNKCSKIIFAKIISKGEILCTNIVNNLLISKNLNTYLINPIKKIISTGNILESYADISLSTKKLKKINISSKKIILMPGFIAGNKKNQLVLLGRNGSDYSAAILSACFKANSCEIWTDVNGVLTCDPKIVSNAKILKNLTYENITELSKLGAKVLHPKSISPLKKFNIPCYIKNTFNKEYPGTKIFKKNKNKKNKNYPSVTYIDKICLFKIKINNYKQKYKIEKKLLKSIKKKYISIILFSNSINSNYINFYIEKKYLKKTKKIFQKIFKNFINKFERKIKIKKKLSIISIVQDKITKKDKLIRTIYKKLNNSNIKIISTIKNDSKNSISFIIKTKNKITAIKLIHKIIINKKKIVELFLLGIGGIGKTLLKQISQEKNILKKKNISIKICLISNSHKLLFKENGIKTKLWKKNFKKTKYNFTKKNKLILKIYKIIKKNCYINPIIIDCTSSTKISNQYIKYIKKGFNIIAANKKFNTGNIKKYKKIRKIAYKKNKQFLYETNVGGGLPIIQTIKNIIQTGDKIVYFQGILSGSLSFIFGKLDEGMLFSKAVKKAKKIGFTEPDPREDLSGLDVARKLLIIARESGYNLELKDIKIDKILPKTLNKNISVKEFLTQIKKFDKFFLKKNLLAKKNLKRIRFIGTIDKVGNCKIKLSEIDKKNPLYEIKNGENAFTFYSKYYQPIPLVIRGYGAGKQVTASGVFSDLLNSIL
ncbi:Bifunctional aspartokinase/homoserine dehydrogenase 1 [Buchnera aphidicola (Periphyllus testudinaceus)]|uniref:bifunctional aspartate kinase/homoserine dehydrogenase I n=1 Tax=Buchnera aphidicola TaxID=9 RepID=UPI0034649A18